MIENNEICQFLDWDSEFFGCRIARATVNRLDASVIDSILQWSCSHQINCLYFLADLDHADTVRLAENNGLRLVDIRVTLEKQLGIEADILSKTSSQRFIRQNIKEDVLELKAIAKINHRDSRFYFDKNFPESRCDALYETWIEKSCSGYANAVFVADIDGQPAGYITCHLLEKTSGKIGLMGVSPVFRGRSLGQALINESLDWFVRKGILQVTVVTQGRNSKALHLYQKCGFFIQSLQLWYHWWFQGKVKEMESW